MHVENRDLYVRKYIIMLKMFTLIDITFSFLPIIFKKSALEHFFRYHNNAFKRKIFNS